MKENQRKCFKCGASPAEDPRTILHRFPKPGKTNSLRCELWAKYCFPRGLWHSQKFQTKLYSEHRMLCIKHFKKSYFVDPAGNRLFKSAVPDEECEMLNVSEISNEIGPSDMDRGTDETSQPLTENNNLINIIQGVDELVVPVCLNKACRICLRSDIAQMGDMDDALTDFYDELVYFDTYEHAALKLCPHCEHQLRKFYNFRQKARRAHILLKTWSTVKYRPVERLEDLHKLVPKSSMGLCTADANQKLYDIVCSKLSEEISTTTASQQNDEFKSIKRSLTVQLADMNTDVNNEFNQCSFEYDSKDYLKNTKKEIIKFEAKTDFKNNDIGAITEVEQSNETGGIHNVDLDSNDIDLEDFAGDNDELMLKINNLGKKLNYRERKRIENRRARILKKKSKLKAFELLSTEERLKLKLDKRELLRNSRYNKRMTFLKDTILNLLDRGELEDIEDLGVRLNEELFLEIIERCSQTTMLYSGLLKGKIEMPKLRRFLLRMLKKYNPAYESIFSVEYLDTHEKRVEAFKSRQHSKEYLEAHYRCEICYRVFDEQGYLDFHKKWHDPKNATVCNICSMSFSKSIRIRRHLYKNHHFLYRCKLCAVAISDIDMMKDHYHEHKGVEFTCTVCHKVFKCKRSMESHRRETHKTKHLCPFCANSFVSPQGLLQHIALKHEDESPELLASKPSVQCELCDSAFHPGSALARHVARSHSQLHSNTFKCFYCKEVFESLESLRTHRKRVEHRTRRARAPAASANQPYRTCPLCKEQVPNKNKLSLFRHYQSAHPAVPYEGQAGTRNYLCEQCGKALQTHAHYVDHLNSHTGEKPYECSECGARFASQTQAKVHVKRHGPRAFPCKHCPKTFTSGSARYNHTMIHIGERRFKCDVCGKGFLRFGNLRSHIDSVHNQIRRTRNKLSSEHSQSTIQEQMIKDEFICEQVDLSSQYVANDEIIYDDSYQLGDYH